MIRLLAILLLAAATPALAQPAGAVPLPVVPPAASVVAPATVRVAMATALGTIVLALEMQRAPVTTAYFLRYVDQKRLDGTSFYRANRLDPAGRYGLIQGGVRGDRKRVLAPVAHEPTSKTGLSHTDGTISLARLAPGTATADFFIVIGDLVALDAAPGGDPGFAAFGKVVEGMDVVRKIQSAPVSATAGDGAMRGQMIEAPVRIMTVRRAK
jgi:peptidyl-prolyl cis-trans isomerase A (cyclophilin A)